MHLVHAKKTELKSTNNVVSIKSTNDRRDIEKNKSMSGKMKLLPGKISIIFEVTWFAELKTENAAGEMIATDCFEVTLRDIPLTELSSPRISAETRATLLAKTVEKSGHENAQITSYSKRAKTT